MLNGLGFHKFPQNSHISSFACTTFLMFLFLQMYVFARKNSEMLEPEVHTLEKHLFYYFKCKHILHCVSIFSYVSKVFSKKGYIWKKTSVPYFSGLILKIQGDCN